MSLGCIYDRTSAEIGGVYPETTCEGISVMPTALEKPLPRKARRSSFGRMAGDVLRDWQLYSLLIAPVAYYLIFKYEPMIGNIIAFRKYVPGGSWLGNEWSGVKYFSMFINDQNFGGYFSIP